MLTWQAPRSFLTTHHANDADVRSLPMGNSDIDVEGEHLSPSGARAEGAKDSGFISYRAAAELQHLGAVRAAEHADVTLKSYTARSNA